MTSSTMNRVKARKAKKRMRAVHFARLFCSSKGSCALSSSVVMSLTTVAFISSLRGVVTMIRFPELPRKATSISDPPAMRSEGTSPPLSLGRVDITTPSPAIRAIYRGSSKENSNMLFRVMASW